MVKALITATKMMKSSHNAIKFPLYLNRNHDASTPSLSKSSESSSLSSSVAASVVTTEADKAADYATDMLSLSCSILLKD